MEQEEINTNLPEDSKDKRVPAKPRSKYFVAIALLLMVIIGVSGQPINPANPGWYTAVLPAILMLPIGGALIASFFSWPARRKGGNGFDSFAIAYLIVALIGFIPWLFGE